MLCPKCSYVRSDFEDVPEWQCPNCGIAYHKYDATEKPAELEKLAKPEKPSPAQNDVGAENKKKGITFKDLRVVLLLLILLFVALDRLFIKVNTSNWQQPLRVVLYPINGDDSEVSARYIKGLQRDKFAKINSFMRREAARYGLAISEPLDIRVGPVVNELPPLPPENGGILETMLWSLQFRYWAWAKDSYDGPMPDIKIFALYNDPTQQNHLPHSTGIEEGMLSIVHVYGHSKMEKQNNFVITHEMLHTLGATDKYDLANNLPLFPNGFAEPEKSPLFPQRFAEVMGGRIPLDQQRAEIPSGLRDAIIGPLTAWEIGWVKAEEQKE